MALDRSDLTQGSIIGKLTQFFLPILFGMLFQQLYNTVDAVIVGKCVGPDALAAVGGSPAAIINLVIGFFTGLSTGATVIISQYYGAHEEELMRRAAHTIVAFCILAGFGLSILGFFSAEWTLRLVDTPEEILLSSRTYLRIYYSGAIPLLLFNIGSGILRALGDSRTPLHYLGICCVLNIALDLLFVVAFRLGVAGVGWATVISLAVSAVLILRHLARDGSPCRLEMRSLRIHSGSLRRILTIGVPAGLQGALFSVSNLIIQAAVNSLGTATMAAWTVDSKFDGLYWVVSSSMGAAICTFVGQCFGAGKIERMKQGIRTWLFAALGVSAAVSVLLLSLAPLGFRLFTDDAQVLALAREMIWYFSPFYVIWAFIEIFSNALRGAGDSFWPMVIILGGVCVFHALWIFFVVPSWHTLLGISICYPISWVLTALIFILYYFRSGWLRRSMGEKK